MKIYENQTCVRVLDLRTSVRYCIEQMFTTRTISTLIAGAIAFVVVPLATQGQAEQVGPTKTIEHLVMPGDTLWDLAAGIPGVDDRREGIHRIIELNNLPNGSLIAGQRIQIPAPAGSVAAR